MTDCTHQAWVTIEGGRYRCINCEATWPSKAVEDYAYIAKRLEEIKRAETTPAAFVPLTTEEYAAEWSKIGHEIRKVRWLNDPNYRGNPTDDDANSLLPWDHCTDYDVIC